VRKSTKTLENQRRNGQGRMSNNNNKLLHVFNIFSYTHLQKGATTTTTTCNTPLPQASISPTFYEQLLRQYSSAKKLHSQTIGKWQTDKKSITKPQISDYSKFSKMSSSIKNWKILKHNFPLSKYLNKFLLQLTILYTFRNTF